MIADLRRGKKGGSSARALDRSCEVAEPMERFTAGDRAESLAEDEGRVAAHGPADEE